MRRTPTHTTKGDPAMSDSAVSGAAALPSRDERIGFLLVFLSALCWSFGGAIARYLEVDDSWTVVFWRSFWAAGFLLGFMAWRDGVAGTTTLFRKMGLPGFVVACCFATASTSFVVALRYTTVANILLMQAGVPLLAALIAWACFAIIRKAAFCSGLFLPTMAGPGPSRCGPIFRMPLPNSMQFNYRMAAMFWYPIQTRKSGIRWPSPSAATGWCSPKWATWRGGGMWTIPM